MRSVEFGKRKEEISLLSVSAEKVFLKSQFVDFMDFWRVLVPVVFAFTLVMLGGIDIFLAQIQQSAAAKSAAALKNGGSDEITAAIATANDFNRSVSLIQTIENSNKPDMPIIDAVETAAASNQIAITNISISSKDGSMTINGTASSEDQIFSFEKNIQGNSSFTNVAVPLSNIQKQINDGSFTFIMTLSAIFR